MCLGSRPWGLMSWSSSSRLGRRAGAGGAVLRCMKEKVLRGRGEFLEVGRDARQQPGRVVATVAEQQQAHLFEAAHGLGREEDFGPELAGVMHPQAAGAFGHGAAGPGIAQLEALALAAQPVSLHRGPGGLLGLGGREALRAQPLGHVPGQVARPLGGLGLVGGPVFHHASSGAGAGAGSSSAGIW